MTCYSEKARQAITNESSTGQPSLPPSGQSYPSARTGTVMYVILGIVSAFLSLLIVPEIFGSVAIILGAYTWKREQGRRGLFIIILGIVCMLVGIYFTSYFALIDLVPAPSPSTTSA
jgi:uncharacterized membrane protein YeaQ/YmgE (transglycosylase-associated protein family)